MRRWNPCFWLTLLAFSGHAGVERTGIRLHLRRCYADMVITNIVFDPAASEAYEPLKARSW